jgi:tetratricopeptide (TPR) repeat protein
LAAAAATAQRGIDSRIVRAQLLSQQRQYQAAITECDAVLRLDPSNEQAAIIKSQIEKLIETESAAATEREIGSRLGRAQSLYQQRQYQPAIAECEAVLRLDHTNKQATSLKSQIQQTMTILGIR